MTHPRTRCDWSDLHTDECAHCLGDDGQPGVVLAPPPPRPKPVVDAAAIRQKLRAATPLRPPGPPQPSLVVARYPVLCALGEDCRPGEHGGPRASGGRSHLCPVCEDRARDNLVAVADAWLDLHQQLVSLRALASAGFTRGDTPGVGLVLNEPASAAIGAATAVGHFYARLVMRERGMAPDDATPPGVLRWLARNHVPWLCRHPDQGVAEAFAVDAADTARQARSAAYPAGWRTIQIPLDCHAEIPLNPDPDDGDEGEDSPTAPCPGRMTARIRPDLHRLPDLVCDTDDTHTVGPDVWQREGWKAAARNEEGARKLFATVRHGVSSLT